MDCSCQTDGFDKGVCTCCGALDGEPCFHADDPIGRIFAEQPPKSKTYNQGIEDSVSIIKEFCNKYPAFDPKGLLKTLEEDILCLKDKENESVS